MEYSLGSSGSSSSLCALSSVCRHPSSALLAALAEERLADDSGLGVWRASVRMALLFVQGSRGPGRRREATPERSC